MVSQKSKMNIKNLNTYLRPYKRFNNLKRYKISQHKATKNKQDTLS